VHKETPDPTARVPAKPPVICRLRARPASIEFHPWQESIGPGTRLLDWCLDRLASLFPDRPHLLVCDPVDAIALGGHPPPADWRVVVSPHFRDLDAVLDASPYLDSSWMLAVQLETALCPIDVAADIAAALDAAVDGDAHGLVIADQSPGALWPVAVNAAAARLLRGALTADQVPPTFHGLFGFAGAAGLERVGGFGCGIANLAVGPAVTAPVAFESQGDLDTIAAAVASGGDALAGWSRAAVAQVLDVRARGRRRATGGSRDSVPRVLFVANASGVSGVESCTVELVRALSRRQVPTEALIAYEGRWTRLLREAGCVVHCRNERLDEDTPRAWYQCVQTLSRHSPDVVHLVGNPGPIIARSAFAAGLPVVLHAHLPSARTYESAIGWVDRFVAVSDSVSEALSSAGADPSLITVVPNGIDSERFAGVRDLRVPARHRLGIPLDAFVVIAMARFSEEKGLDLLVDAISLLRPHAGDVHVVIAGEGHSSGSTRAALMEQIDRHGLQEAVHLHGFASDVRPLIGAADVVVVPSTFEAFGMVGLEALASGVLLVSTPVGGLQEFIGELDDPAACAVRIGSRDPHELCGTLRTSRERPAAVAAIATRGQRLVRERYSADTMAERFMTIYEDLLSAPTEKTREVE
jgi:glycosyltransferase involved in cell wall biosynthesis